MAESTRKIKVGVEIDGEAQFKRSIAEINEGSKVLASEMRKLQAEYQGNADSMEYLAGKGDILERQLLTQKEKVDELRAALAHAAEQYGESDRRTQEYAVQLNNAEAAQYKLEAAIRENSEAMQGQDEAMVGLGDTVEQLAEKFGVRIPDGAKQALNGITGFSTGTVAAMAGVAAAVVAVIEVLKQLGQATLDVAAQVDEYLTESIVTGLSTTTLQIMDYMEDLVDVPAETIKSAMVKLTQAMDEARDGVGATAEAFEALGISVTDSSGHLRSTEEVFYEVIDALGNVENQTERNVLTNELMGKSAQELNPLILEGSEAFREYGEAAEEAGYILDEYQLKTLGEVDDAYQELQLTLEGSTRQLVAQFAPAVKEAMELFSDVVKKAGEMLINSGIVDNLSLIIENLIDIVRTVGELIGGIPGLQDALKGLSVVLGAVAQFTAVIADAAGAVTSLLRLDFSGFKNAIGLGYSSGNANNYQRTVMRQQGTLDMYDSFYGRNAGGTSYWRGGMTWVGEAGPELVSLPRGSSVLSNQESEHSTGDTFYITMNVDPATIKDLDNLLRMAKDARIQKRMR